MLESKPEDTRAKATVLFTGTAGYRINALADSKNVDPGVIIKELALEGLKALGLVHPRYTLIEMRTEGSGIGKKSK